VDIVTAMRRPKMPHAIRDRRAIFAAAFLGALAAGVLAHEREPHWISWNVFALSLAGFGTLALALVTMQLVGSSDRGIKETHRLAALSEREQEARIRPVVLLWQDPEWFASGRVGRRTAELPFHNAGGGPAINVEVQVYWPGGDCALATTSLGPGERTRMFARTRIGELKAAWGMARYGDLLGRRWETRFAIEIGPDSQPQFQLRAYGIAELLPQLAHPAGWEYGANGLPRICVPTSLADVRPLLT
jgi:hypothetical protein